jgi:hypothetical protein
MILVTPLSVRRPGALRWSLGLSASVLLFFHLRFRINKLTLLYDFIHKNKDVVAKNVQFSPVAHGK